MGSVPALSVLILGIVVPALAAYIEVSHPQCGRFILGQFSVARLWRSKSFRPVFVFSACEAQLIS